MSDLIDRRTAIDALGEGAMVNYQASGHGNGLIKAIDVIKDLPSAQPERKKGKWINRSLNILYPEWERYTCSACGKHSYNYDFCPNCGSYNGGESDDKG